MSGERATTASYLALHARLKSRASLTECTQCADQEQTMGNTHTKVSSSARVHNLSLSLSFALWALRPSSLDHSGIDACALCTCISHAENGHVTASSRRLSFSRREYRSAPAVMAFRHHAHGERRRGGGGLSELCTCEDSSSSTSPSDLPFGFHIHRMCIRSIDVTMMLCRCHTCIWCAGVIIRVPPSCS